MDSKEALEIEIGPDGEVRVHVKGRKGTRCLEVRELFKEFLGPVTATDHTEEYHQHQGEVHFAETVKNHKD